MGALFLTVIMGLVTLVVDVGLFFHERREMQNAADAAALAGARELPYDPTLAEQKALDWLAKNGIDVEGGEVESVEISTTYVPNDTIRVSVRREVNFFLARVFGKLSGAASASATARVGSPAGLKRFIPFAALESVLGGLSPGQEVTLKYDAQDQTRGNSLALAFPGSSGANDFKNNIINGSEHMFCVFGQEYPGCSSTISTEPGAMIGPTQQGMQQRLASTGARCDTFEEVVVADPENPDNYFLDSACNPFPPYNVADSNRLLIVPVTNSLCAGRCDIPIVRFALVFLEGVQCSGGGGTCEVWGRYAIAAWDPGSPDMGPYDPNSSFSFVGLIE